MAAPHVVSGADGEIRRINPAPEQCIYLNPELRPVVLYIEDVDG